MASNNNVTHRAGRISWVNTANCTPPAIDDFPGDFFTEEQRQEGAVIVHLFISLYCFYAVAVVCDKYFVPAVERICSILHMSGDVAGATFMAAATSAPEMFVNVIGTFITEGDIGVGTIVGSAVFNILAVAACCGIGAGMVVPLEWWPLTRDCVAYGITVVLLIITIRDERVEWYEALTLVLIYFVYIAVMYYDTSIQKAFKRFSNDAKKLESVPSRDVEARDACIPLQDTDSKATTANENDKENGRVITITEEFKSEKKYLSTYPKGKSFWIELKYIISWPIHFILFLTVPDCENPNWTKWYPATFCMCIVWIGSLTYIVSWAITIIGDTMKIPDSVMGITFLAAGTSIPEAVSSVIVAKQGHGSMGISNSIGSNTFDILLCLGLPWFIKAAFLPTRENHHYITIQSSGLEYSAISLLSSLFLLYMTFFCNKFRLDHKVGIVCLIMYVCFLVLASVIELNVFFVVNLPTCE
ncbi:Hypothetical predicted protein [Cloeon dipterum]|uniref:Sodium/potassium/calcium exchanger 5 n=1 Tax=Cloeon dipterum TaxID=197152 RepID=A0A8S1BS31_9INSE|nr:Hypothetical predicted protein [Cloeon dipterum]